MSTPAVCSALFILDSNFKTLLSRDWRGDTPPTAVERFINKIQDCESESDQRPVIEDEDARCTYVYIKHNNLWLLAVCRNNSNAVALLTFLHHLVQIFIHYFKVQYDLTRTLNPNPPCHTAKRPPPPGFFFPRLPRSAARALSLHTRTFCVDHVTRGGSRTSARVVAKMHTLRESGRAARTPPHRNSVYTHHWALTHPSRDNATIPKNTGAGGGEHQG